MICYILGIGQILHRAHADVESFCFYRTVIVFLLALESFQIVSLARWLSFSKKCYLWWKILFEVLFLEWIRVMKVRRGAVEAPGSVKGWCEFTLMSQIDSCDCMAWLQLALQSVCKDNSGASSNQRVSFDHALGFLCPLLFFWQRCNPSSKHAAVGHAHLTLQLGLLTRLHMMIIQQLRLSYNYLCAWAGK